MAVKGGKLLSNQAGLSGPITHAWVFTFEDIAANATSSNQYTLHKLPAGGAVYLAMAYEKVALAGASDITLDVGITTGDPDEFINAWDADGGTPVANNGDAFDAVTITAGGSAYEIALIGGGTNGALSGTAVDIVAEWNGTVASLTAGEVVIALGIADPAGSVAYL